MFLFSLRIAIIQKIKGGVKMKKSILLIFIITLSFLVFGLSSIIDLDLTENPPENGFITLQTMTQEENAGHFAVNGWVYKVSEDDSLFELSGSALTEKSLTEEQMQKIGDLLPLGPLVIEWDELQKLSDTLENREGFIYNLLESDNPIAYLGVSFENLPNFNGDDSKPISVAAFGTVYVVADLGKWKSGSHYSRHSSGEELTYALDKQAPHSERKIEGAEPLGLLIALKENLEKILENEGNYEKVENTIEDKRVKTVIAYIAF